MDTIIHALTPLGEAASTLYIEEADLPLYADMPGFALLPQPDKPWPENTTYLFVGGAWMPVPDYRHRIFFDQATGDEVQILEPNRTPPPGYVEGRSPASPVMKAQLLAAVKAEWAARFNAPIAYDGKLIDADPQARENIAGWMGVLNSGASLPPGFVWRDAGGTDHPCDAAWLKGLATALALRGTALYTAKWAHEQAISSASDLTNYDVTTGWPA